VPTPHSSVLSLSLDRDGQQRGAANAARHLLVNGDSQDGFRRLVAAERADLTVEWSALHPRWHRIFQEPHREAARWRLRQARGREPPRCLTPSMRTSCRKVNEGHPGRSEG